MGGPFFGLAFQSCAPDGRIDSRSRVKAVRTIRFDRNSMLAVPRHECFCYRPVGHRLMGVDTLLEAATFFILVPHAKPSAMANVQHDRFVFGNLIHDQVAANGKLSEI